MRSQISQTDRCNRQMFPLASHSQVLQFIFEDSNIVMTAINTKKSINGLGIQELEMSMYTKCSLIPKSLYPCILVLVPLDSTYLVSLSFFTN